VTPFHPVNSYNQPVELIPAESTGNSVSSRVESGFEFPVKEYRQQWFKLQRVQCVGGPSRIQVSKKDVRDFSLFWSYSLAYKLQSHGLRRVLLCTDLYLLVLLEKLCRGFEFQLGFLWYSYPCINC